MWESEALNSNGLGLNFQALLRLLCLSTVLISPCNLWVPHGTVLGPLFFCSTHAHSSRSMSNIKVKHFKTGDIQLYLSFEPGDGNGPLWNGKAELAGIREWMASNLVDKITNKTIHFENPRQVSKKHNFQLLVGNDTYNPSACVRNLGV